MAAKDIFHEVVKTALKKEGWKITHDPLYIKSGGVQMEIDLGADKLIAAEKENERIAVEIKSFAKPSAISEFHTALGQYLNYRKAITRIESERILYLAVPEETYEVFFSLPFVAESVVDYQINLIVYDSENEAIALWKK